MYNRYDTVCNYVEQISGEDVILWVEEEKNLMSRKRPENG